MLLFIFKPSLEKIILPYFTETAMARPQKGFISKKLQASPIDMGLIV
jgi:hypothetical protein